MINFYFLFIFKATCKLHMDTIIVLCSTATIISFYTLYNSITLDASLRYFFDLGFNIGMGEGNIPEKDDVSLFVSTIWMLLGYFVFFKWCLALVKATLGQTTSGLFHEIALYSRRAMLWVSQWTKLSPSQLSVVITFMWSFFGVCIGVFVEEWTFIKSVNFAVGAMTTTGSQTVSNKPLANLLTVLFLLGGVPLLSITSAIIVTSGIEDGKDEVSTISESEPLNKADGAIQF